MWNPPSIKVIIYKGCILKTVCINMNKYLETMSAYVLQQVLELKPKERWFSVQFYNKKNKAKQSTHQACTAAHLSSFLRYTCGVNSYDTVTNPISDKRPNQRQTS